MCRRAVVTGNLVQDAWFAALAVESGCEWVTTDGDFARFARLRWRRPF
jgi:predicted nucleic acid-binding protein